MKINRFYMAMLSLSVPFALYSMGMGEMKVTSFLNQPFNAEIPLIDVGGVPVDGIKATLASLEEFERIGLELNETLSFLKFEIRRNTQGKIVIHIWSDERITEPYLELLVDLAWANGQLYRAYTILLDPPGYKLMTSHVSIDKLPVYKSGVAMKGEPGVINKPVYTQIIQQPEVGSFKRQEATYGPTIANESIWQIAQRYSTPDTSLQQIILAIVGTNSQAFTQGNLNGLKIGERLRIPSNEEVLKVPEELAKQEVDAHDVAWKSGQAIKHVLLPPYIEGVKGESQFTNKGVPPLVIDPVVATKPIVQPDKSVLPVIPATLPVPVVNESSVLISYLPPTFSVGALQMASKAPAEKDAISSAANNSVRMENSLLKERMIKLELENQKLRRINARQLNDFKKLQEQVQFIKLELDKQRQTINQPASVNPVPPAAEASNFWLYLLLIAGIAGGSTLGYLAGAKRREEVFIDDEAGLPTDETINRPDLNQPVPAGRDDRFYAKEATIQEPNVAEVISPQSQVLAEEPSKVNAPTITARDLSAEDKFKAPEIIQESFQSPTEVTPDSSDVGNEIETLVPTETLEQIPHDSDEFSDDNASEPPAPLYTPVPHIKEYPFDQPQKHSLDFEPGLDRDLTINKDKNTKPVTPHEQEIEFVPSSIPGTDKSVSRIKKKDEPAVVDKVEPITETEVPGQPDVATTTDPDAPLESNWDTELDSSAKSELERQSQPEIEEIIFLPELDLDAPYDAPQKISAPDEQSNLEIPTAEMPTEDKIPEKEVKKQSSKLVKNKAALDTLLALAKTYISMQDFELAKQSLQEVVNFGDENQKIEAQKLLEEISAK